MNEVILQTIYFIMSYLGIIFFFFFSINWLSKGWLMTFIKAKASKGKKLIVICHGITGTYYQIGTIDKGALKFKDSDKQGQTFTSVKREDIIQTMGVQGIEIDITNKNIIQRGQARAGCDPIDTDNFINRIIMAPSVNDNFKQYILIAIIIIILLLIVNVYFGFSTLDILENLKLQGVIK